MVKGLLLFTFSVLASGSLLVRLAPRADVLESVSQLRSSYDYVVIRGGTSGLVVANRLTENPSS